MSKFGAAVWEAKKLYSQVPCMKDSCFKNAS